MSFKAYPTKKEKWLTGLQAFLIIVVFFALILFSGQLNFTSPPPPVLEIALVNSPPPLPKPTMVPKTTPKPIEKKLPRLDITKKKQAEILQKKQQAEKIKQQNIAKEKQRQQEAQREKQQAEKKREEVRLEKQRQQEKADLREKQRLTQLAKIQRQAVLNRRLTRVGEQLARRIRARINDYLTSPPDTPRDCSVFVVLGVSLSSSGELKTQPKIIESSGNEKYNNQAIKALHQATPLPMPQEAFILNNPHLMREFLYHRLSIYPDENC